MNRTLCSLALAILVVAAPLLAAELPPPVKAALTAETMVLSFPAGTIKESVSFTCHGMSITRHMIGCCRKAFSWTSDTDLTVNLGALPGKKGGGKCCKKGKKKRGCSGSACCKKASYSGPAELWVWGQLMSGEALLQKITLNQQ